MKKILLYILCGFFFTQNTGAQAPSYPKAASSLRIMSYNIRNAKGMDLKTDYARIANVMNGLMPDVIAVQEVDSMTNRSNGTDVLTELATLTEMHGTFGEAISYDGGKYGVAILSKEAPLKTHNIPLPGEEEARTLLIAEFEGYVFACTHWSLTKEDRFTAVAIADAIARVFDKPFFMAGDFNMEPESAEFQLLSENWKVLNNLKNNTFPADEPDVLIDYIFLYSAPAYEIKLLQDSVLNEPIASDHRPVFVDVEL